MNGIFLPFRNCQNFTYDPENYDCTAFLNCVQISDVSCPDCVSGSVDCDSGDDLVCLQPGRCLGTFIDNDYSVILKSCSESCAEEPECQWWSFDETEELCTLTKDCDTVDKSCEPYCYFGQKGCNGNGKIC